MARLQDFNTVTPTSSDKLLVVQSQGQGLVPYGSKLDSANPTGTGTLTMTGSGVFSGDLTINGNASLTDHIGSVRTQVIKGGTRWQLARTSEGTLTAPLSVLIHGFKCLYLASTASAASAISDLVSIYSGDSGATITLSSGVLQMGTDANRQYVCIMPNTVKLVQVTT